MNGKQILRQAKADIAAQADNFDMFTWITFQPYSPGETQEPPAEIDGFITGVKFDIAGAIVLRHVGAKHVGFGVYKPKDDSYSIGTCVADLLGLSWEDCDLLFYPSNWCELDERFCSHDDEIYPTVEDAITAIDAFIERFYPNE